MTEHKMAMVSNKFLSAVAVDLGLHKRLRACSQQIGVRISEYALELQELKETVGRVDYWVNIQTEPPSKFMSRYYVGAFTNS